MRSGTIAIVFVLLTAALTAGGYFVYRTNPEVRNWIQTTFNISLPNGDNLASPLSLARDQERKEDVKVISDAIFQYTSEKKGLLPKDFPLEETCIGTVSPCYNLKILLVPIFVDKIPMDPQTGSEENTGFTTYKNSDGRIVVGVKGELGGEFEVIR